MNWSKKEKAIQQIEEEHNEKESVENYLQDMSELNIEVII
jgi:hypothetical protein